MKICEKLVKTLFSYYKNLYVWMFALSPAKLNEKVTIRPKFALLLYKKTYLLHISPFTKT